MAISLGFHIILAALGIGFPLITLIAHWRGLRTGDNHYLELARRWAKTMAVLFAVGAVSGTILSFEMGMLWPGLMGPYGDVIGLPFTLEGVSFFLEAIFIGIYLYGWKRMSARLHFLSLFPIVLAGIAGSFFILTVNSWMNSPAGFEIVNGEVVNVDPWAAMFNDATAVQYTHMLLAAYMVSGFLVAGVYAWGWLKGRRDRHHKLGFIIAFSVAAVAAPIQILVGDTAARRLIDAQPAKFAAMELVTEGGSNAPFTIGGILVDGEVVGAIEIPGLGSLLGTRSFDGELPGLDDIPPDEIPPVNIVHISFQVMVAIGTGLLLLSAWFAIRWWRKKSLPESRWFWRLAAVSGAAAVVAMEAGWITTEVGRQPWIVWQQVRTADAVTNADGLIWSLILITVVYVGLATASVLALKRISRGFASGQDVATPYGPPVPEATGD
ncbi:MAG: cytochrome ubiquinol oxidase subunit I [Actinobacteria bacterium]|nr:MAG: cytochrome ubiquinol oxidase subunit I [Actinomycetota bacterium]REK40009.1 MAG: cytochrome ubiquinol oxidase subunit I [Actinomycetota bacterium]